MTSSTVQTIPACYHCGEEAQGAPVNFDDKVFCCQGCRSVYQLLNKHGMCEYYAQEANPGLSQRVAVRQDKFAFLDDKNIQQQLVQFSDKGKVQVQWYLPQIHCSSCLWLLEHLHKINPAIMSSRVLFHKKELTVLFNEEQVSLRQLAELLTSIGYEPHIGLNDLSAKKVNHYNKRRIYQLGVAGFCFANIMLLSFPEYFGLKELSDTVALSPIFRWLSLLLSLPVFFYSARDFFTSGWQGLRCRYLNIDAPIALAVLITFTRSVYEIVTATGAGYLDSMSGIVFFMLAGRALQDRTNNALSFERDYTSYFPVAVHKVENGKEKPAALPELKTGDTVLIHHQEIIPADGILLRGNACIDYSFVTGETVPVPKQIGELVYAGGRQTEGNIELLLVKDVSQSYLTSLWNNECMRSEKKEDSSYVHKISSYFTLVLFAVAATAGLWWWGHDAQKVWPVITAVLIVACPCALLLSQSFTNSHILSIFDKAALYVRNASVIERMCSVGHLVFDKTGTLTRPDHFEVVYKGDILNTRQRDMLASVLAQTHHPLSKAALHSFSAKTHSVQHFKEIPGKGCEAWMEETYIKLGSPSFVFGTQGRELNASAVAFSIDGMASGCFLIKTSFRTGVPAMIQRLQRRFSLSVISGDNENEKPALEQLTRGQAALHFFQSPADKLEFVTTKQRQGVNVMMIGDGLNDAGALKQSHVGLAVTDNVNNFSPACDAIIDAAQLHRLPGFLRMARCGRRIVLASFLISILYNVVGLSFAVQGLLSPMIAAILMPASSISIVLFTWVATQWCGWRLLRK